MTGVLSHELTENGGSHARSLPGYGYLRTPTLALKKCPQCGEEVEILSNYLSELEQVRFLIYNDS